MVPGQRVTTPYRSLGQGAARGGAAWTMAQNAHTEAWLAATPVRAGIRRRLEQLLAIGSIGAPTPVRGRYLYQRRDGTQSLSVNAMHDPRARLSPTLRDTAGP